MDSTCDSRGKRPNNARGLGAERIELSTPRLKGMSATDVALSEFGWRTCPLNEAAFDHLPRIMEPSRR